LPTKIHYHFYNFKEIFYGKYVKNKQGFGSKNNEKKEEELYIDLRENQT
jgi:hypothetical protein